MNNIAMDLIKIDNYFYLKPAFILLRICRIKQLPPWYNYRVIYLTDGYITYQYTESYFLELINRGIIYAA